MDGSRYLNDEGSRWTVPGHRAHVYIDGQYQGTRAVDYAEAFGNFAALAVRVRGTRYKGLPESFPADDGQAILCFGDCPTCKDYGYHEPDKEEDHGGA